MMRRRDQIRKRYPNTKTETDKSQVIFFGCNKLGHYKSECPELKNTQRKPPFKNKSMLATWDDLEDSQP